MDSYEEHTESTVHDLSGTISIRLAWIGQGGAIHRCWKQVSPNALRKDRVLLFEFQKTRHVNVAPQVYYALLIILAGSLNPVIDSSETSILGPFGGD